MIQSRLLAFVGLTLLVAARGQEQGGEVLSQRISEVFVVNFPTVWTIEGSVEVEGAVRLSETGPSYRRYPPRLGEHNEEIRSRLEADVSRAATAPETDDPVR